MKFDENGENIDIMQKTANHYTGGQDVMNYYAMVQRGADFCPNCSNYLEPISWDKKECQECGKTL